MGERVVVGGRGRFPQPRIENPTSVEGPFVYLESDGWVYVSIDSQDDDLSPQAQPHNQERKKTEKWGRGKSKHEASTQALTMRSDKLVQQHKT